METAQMERTELMYHVIQDDCRHHWVIEMAQGPTSRGRCKHCKSERDFFNDPDQAVYQAAPTGPTSRN
jgi:hypothetical protein